MATVTKPQYFIGTVKSIEGDSNLKNSREYHEIIVDIPGVIQGVKAFPEMSELDEPKVGDQVLLLSLDPVYNSYFIYRKLKENDFIGFRDSGKMVDITPDYITVGVFKEDLKDYGNDEHWDGTEISKNHITSVTIDKEGTITIEAAKDNGSKGNLDVYLKGDSNIEIHGSKGNTIKIDKDSNIEIGGESKVKITGNCNITCTSSVKIKATQSCNIEATSSCTVKSPSITLKGPGHIYCNSNSTELPTNPLGPFCTLGACLFTGAVHATPAFPNL